MENGELGTERIKIQNFKCMKNKDSALKRAVVLKEEERTTKYPHNFPFMAMDRIRTEEKHRAKRTRFVEIAVCSAACVAGLAVLFHFVDFIQFKESVPGIFKEVHIAKNNGDFSWGTVVATLLCCIFFASLNHHLSKKFKG